jgi:hypothetical protein
MSNPVVTPARVAPSRPAEPAPAAPPTALFARTGQSCPRSGLWQVVSRPVATAVVPGGRALPSDHGRAVVWRLVRADAS